MKNFLIFVLNRIFSNTINQVCDLLDQEKYIHLNLTTESNITPENKCQHDKIQYLQQLIYLFDIFHRIVLIDHYLFATQLIFIINYIYLQFI